jgi:uncharacterized protein YdaU (DUF1376 family)
LHYFQFNIGDYASHTRHLSREEDLAYRRLLDLYYLQEKPLPADPEKCAKLILMSDCSADVERVLNEFFTPVEDGWANKRADQEIEKFHGKSDKARAAGLASAEARKQRMLSECSTDVQPNKKQETRTNNQEPVITLPKGRESEAGLPPCPHQKVVDLFHELLPELPRVLVWNKTREGYLRARWREKAVEEKWQTEEQGLEFFRKFFDYVRKSKFLMGKTHTPGKRTFECELEWLLRPTNWVKIIEGKYHGS